MVDDGPTRSRAEVRRAHLLETARALFIEHGFHRTGVAQIASASGIKVGQIYRDFSSKEDVIAAICERDVVDWLGEDILARAVANGDQAAVREWMNRFLQNDEPVEECRLMNEIVAEAGRSPRIAELNRSIDQRIRARLSAALAALTGRADRGDERERLADFILALGLGIMTRRAFDPELNVQAMYDYASMVVDQRIRELAEEA